MNIKKLLSKTYVNFRGWSTRRKIVVIESDDWGSVRMPSKEAYDKLKGEGLNLDNSYFLKYDCLESREDLELLFGLLSSYKDKNGRHPAITANAVTANPDFKKIAASGKTEYHYEMITDTYNRYPDHKGTFELWKNEGMANKLLWPQFHGREHINVDKWMRAINAGIRQEDLAFENEVVLGLGSETGGDRKLKYMAAFEYDSEADKKRIEQITLDGLLKFHELFGLNSQTFVASCSVRGEHLDPVLRQGGVLFHQCGQQLMPDGKGGLQLINRYWGDHNNEGQYYWRRNATFEPSRGYDKDAVGECLKEMEIAFMLGKPAVINSHRVNYSGGISVANRDKTLKLLKELLDRATKKWPSIEFMTSDELGQYMLLSKE